MNANIATMFALARTFAPRMRRAPRQDGTDR